MTDNAPPVLIAGAGIGGLTTLLTLHACGIDAIAIDRATTLDAVGVGINLQPHAVRELHRLGLGERLGAISIVPHDLEFYDPRGELLWREPLGMSGGYKYPQCSVHRGDLQMLLLDAVTDRLGEHAVIVDTALVGVDDVGDHVRVTTSQGNSSAAMVVGADGIHSTVRALLHPPEDDPILPSGTRMYRGATPMSGFLDGATMVIVKTGHGVELVLYPLVGGLINWVLLVPDDQDPAMGQADWQLPVDRDYLIAQVQGWRLDWLDPGALIGSTNTITPYAMVDREPLTWWGSGRITLLGDAAHPMYPVGANGGSQTIVDAAVLAQCLAHDPADGVRDYERRRIPATADVVRANRERHHSDPHHQSEAAARYRAQTRADADATTTDALHTPGTTIN
ncbi:FAD-dependent monooxygenase [Mycobacterium sp. 141]|uniref:FAD-dependent monooxygenase n=1 Tax=Mycobacterium sp. 141 TaxID=1120797 RepID=UPI000369BB0D|nr:FAD-dependent monooxygenase [Mycobacterium sp. 141]